MYSFLNLNISMCKILSLHIQRGTKKILDHELHWQLSKYKRVMCAYIENIMHLQNENSKFNIVYLYKTLQKFDYNILFLLVKGVSGEKRIHFTAKLAPAWIIWTNTQLTKSLEDLSDRIIIHYLHLPQISSNHTI